MSCCPRRTPHVVAPLDAERTRGNTSCPPPTHDRPRPSTAFLALIRRFFGPSARITFLEQRAHVSQKSKSAMKLSGNLMCLQKYADNSVHALVAPPDSFSVPNQSSTVSAPNSPFRAAFQSPQAPKHLWPPRDFKVRRNARIVCWAS